MSRPTDMQRFESKVARDHDPAGCHIWIGGFAQFGMPNFCVGGGSRSARRWLWEQVHGPLDKTKWVTPVCEELKCVNLDHLGLRSHNDDISRFWEKVQKADGDGCWLWTGRLQKGYPIIHLDQHPTLAHRFSYELHFGKIVGHVPGHPELEWCVCHTCDVCACVRPEHLFLGRDKDNHDDMVAKGRHARGDKLREGLRRARAVRTTPDLIRRAHALRSTGLSYASIGRELMISEVRARKIGEPSPMKGTDKG